MRNPDGSKRLVGTMGPGKAATCWTIRWRDGFVDGQYISTTKKLCIERWMHDKSEYGDSWKGWEKVGYRCVKVRVMMWEILSG